MLNSINIMKNLQQLTGKTASKQQMAVSNSHITILTLNVKGLNASIKRHRLAKIYKAKPIGVLYLGNPSHMQGYTKA